MDIIFLLSCSGRFHDFELREVLLITNNNNNMSVVVVAVLV